MLFLLVGVIYDRAHHREIAGFGGLASIMAGLHGRTGLPLSRRWASRGCPPSSPRCSSCSAPGRSIRAHRRRRERGRPDGRLSPLDAPAHVPGPPNEKYRALPEISRRASSRWSRSARIVIFLGIYPTPILNLQGPALLRLNEHVQSATRTPAPDMWRRATPWVPPRASRTFRPELALAAAVIAVVLLDLLVTGPAGRPATTWPGKLR